MGHVILKQLDNEIINVPLNSYNNTDDRTLCLNNEFTSLNILCFQKLKHSFRLLRAVGFSCVEHVKDELDVSHLVPALV